MKFIKHLLKYNKVNNDYSKQISQPSKEVFSTVNENISTIKQIFSNTEDLVVKEFKAETVRGVLIYLETMVDKEKIQRDALKPCLLSNSETIQKVLSTHFQATTVFNQVEDALLKGSCVLSLDGYEKLLWLMSLCLRTVLLQNQKTKRLFRVLMMDLLRTF